MRAHVASRQLELSKYQATGELQRFWHRALPADRRKLLGEKRGEVLLAVSDHIGGDGELLKALVPELTDHTHTHPHSLTHTHTPPSGPI